MTHLLLDEMWPPEAARLLREHHGQSATHVFDEGLGATEDHVIAAQARSRGWCLVTENVIDFVGEPDLAVVFVRKRDLPAGRAQAPALAQLLATWSRAHPEPYLGGHWPH